MKHRIFLTAAIAAGLGWAAFSTADTVVLKNGRQLDGVVIDNGEDMIQIKTDQMDMWIERDKVAEIIKDSSPDFFVNEGDRHMVENDIEAAKGAYKQALDLDPDNTRAKDGLAKIEAMSREEYLKHTRQTRDADVDALLEKARDLIDHGHQEEAIATMKEAYERNPSHPETLLMATEYALEAWNKGMAPESMYQKYLMELERVDPDNPEIPAIKDRKDKLGEIRKNSFGQDSGPLYQQIKLADRQKNYTPQTLNMIERALALETNPAKKAELEEIQKRAMASGVVASGPSAIPAPAAQKPGIGLRLKDAGSGLGSKVSALFSSKKEPETKKPKTLGAAISQAKAGSSTGKKPAGGPPPGKKLGSTKVQSSQPTPSSSYINTDNLNPFRGKK